MSTPRTRPSLRRQSSKRRAQAEASLTTLLKNKSTAELVHDVALQKNENKNKLQLRAVSLEFLLRFSEYIRNTVGEKKFKELSTGDLVHGQDVMPEIVDGQPRFTTSPEPYSIRALTQEMGTNMAEFLGERGRKKKTSKALRKVLEGFDPELPQEVADLRKDGEEGKEPDWFGATDVFISHPWSLKFHDLLEALKEPRCTNSKDLKTHYQKKMWLDIFAVNQHYLADDSEMKRAKEERSFDLTNFPTVIEGATDGMVLVACPWKEVRMLDRAWCWYEIGLALRHNKEIFLALTHKDQDELRDVSTFFTKPEKDRSPEEAALCETCTKMLTNINVEESECLLPEDNDRIKKDIAETVGLKQANQSVKLAIAGLLMTTADQLLRSHNTNGTHALYLAMLAHFEDAPREKARAFNSLVRVYTIMGRRDRAMHYGTEAVAEQRKLLAELREQAEARPNDRGVVAEMAGVELELGANLNSLGRAKCDGKALAEALGFLEEAREIRERHNDGMLSEVLYNIGRAYVLFYEAARAGHEQCLAAALARDEAKDLAEAAASLGLSMELQEAHERRSGTKLPSLGACYVFVGKAMDLQGQNAEAAFTMFIQGEKQQVAAYGKLDPRVFMTKLDTARHLVERGVDADLPDAWAYYVAALTGLRFGVRELGGEPLKLLECASEMLSVMDRANLCGCGGDGGAEVAADDDGWACECHDEDAYPECRSLLADALADATWVEKQRPHLTDMPAYHQLLEKIRGRAVQAQGSKLRVALKRIRERAEGAGKEEGVQTVLAAEAFQAQLRRERGGPSKVGAVPALLKMPMEDVLESVPAGMVDVIVADPPYNIGLDTLWDEMGHERFVNSIEKWSRLMVEALAPGGIGFAFTNAQYVSYWMTALRTARGAAALNEASVDPAPVVIVECAVWFKPNAAWRDNWVAEHKDKDDAFSEDFKNAPQVVRDCIEMVVIFRRDKSASMPFKNLVESALAENSANVWNQGKCVPPERLQKPYWHPAQKPLSLIRPLVQIGLAKTRKERDVLVVEPFMGTGAAAVACMELGIPCIGCDLEDKWVECVQSRCTSATLTKRTEVQRLRRLLDDKEQKKKKRSTLKLVTGFFSGGGGGGGGASGPP